MTAITMRLLILALAACAAAHESCCEKAAEAEPEFIIDPDDAPPDVYEGEPRYVADPADTAPAAWDEDEDGPYERRLIENPRYAWAPREIENPRYRPPASLGERYADEVRAAAPWVALGAIVAAVLDAAPVSAEINQCVRPAWRYYLLLWPPRRSARVLGVLTRGVLAYSPELLISAQA